MLPEGVTEVGMDLRAAIRGSRWGTQRRFAEAMGVSEAVVSRWCSGEVAMPLHRIAEAGRLLGSIEWAMADPSMRRIAGMAWRSGMAGLAWRTNAAGPLSDLDVARQARGAQRGVPVSVSGRMVTYPGCAPVFVPDADGDDGPEPGGVAA